MSTTTHTVKSEETVFIDGLFLTFLIFSNDDESDGPWIEVLKPEPAPLDHFKKSAGKLVLGSQLIVDNVTMTLNNFKSGSRADITFSYPDHVRIEPGNFKARQAARLKREGRVSAI